MQPGDGSEMGDILREFLIESTEGLDQLERDLVALEKAPGDPAHLGSIFRCIHTIKGASGFLGLAKLEGVTHAGENVLSRLRDGTITLDAAVTERLLELVDATRGILRTLETRGEEGDADHAALIARLEACLAAEATGPRSAQPTPPAVPDGAVPPGSVAERSGDEPAGGSAALDSTIRVDVGLLDKLMNLVGELVLARNQVLQHSGGFEDAAFVATTQRLNLITTELQEGVMKTRMQPIGTVWSKLPRVVRDLARHCGKQVSLAMEGRETELDKTIIEAIKDPLTHMLRNAVDHGIESPEARVAVGKPAEGRLLLRAFHEGGQVILEMVDDGAGIDPERIRTKAIHRGLVTADQAGRMSDREVFTLIFEPGFSTAEQLTNLSGRGVGMDVVKTNIEKIGGVVDIQSSLGKGTTVRLKIPSTLAIIPALVVTCGAERYAIPQVSLLELVRLDATQVDKRIETIQGVPVYRLRGNLLPLIELREVLRLADGPGGGAVVNIVVLQADDRQFGLVVDRINDTEEIVVKPLSTQLKALPIFAGATIMGDGRVALILDILGIAQRASVISEIRDRALLEQAAARTREANQNRQLLLLCAGFGGERLAIPLASVARLEEFPAGMVERVGGHAMVQYRGEIIRLLSVRALLPERRRTRRGGPAQQRDAAVRLPVVVFTHAGRSAGLMVEQVLDVVEEDLAALQPATRAGVLGCLVVQGRVTELLDVAPILAHLGAAAETPEPALVA